MAHALFFPLAALRHNLKRLLVIRLIVLGCQAAVLVWALLGPQPSLDYRALWAILALSALHVLALFLRLRLSRAVAQTEFLGHLLLDIVLLSLLLYFSGGANNPFVSFYLVPLTISAATLPWSHTWLVAAASLCCYTLLLFFHQPLPALMPEHGADEASAPLLNLHILGMWFNFLVSAGLITWFVVKMAAELRQQEARLARYREENLRDEQILAVATQAAGTAHELGTPLGTLAVGLKELARSHADQPALRKRLELLRGQVERCRQSLRELVTQADLRGQRSPPRLSLTRFIDRLLEQWRLLRPEVPLAYQQTSTEAVPQLPADSILQQAIFNLLNNAADASPEGIEARLDWSSETWRLILRDHGPGLPRDLADDLGIRFVSGKQSGLGVGLVLSQASINRLGGEVRLFPHPEGGTVTEIRMPIQRCARV